MSVSPASMRRTASPIIAWSSISSTVIRCARTGAFSNSTSLATCPSLARSALAPARGRSLHRSDRPAGSRPRRPTPPRPSACRTPRWTARPARSCASPSAAGPATPPRRRARCPVSSTATPGAGQLRGHALEEHVHRRVVERAVARAPVARTSEAGSQHEVVVRARHGHGAGGDASPVCASRTGEARSARRATPRGSPRTARRRAARRPRRVERRGQHDSTAATAAGPPVDAPIATSGGAAGETRGDRDWRARRPAGPRAAQPP